MAQVSITQLPDAQALTGTESVPIVQNGVTVQTTTGAIAGAGALNYPFLTVGSTVGLTQARYITVGSGLTTTDGGAGSTLQISLTGTVPSLNALGNGFVVKTGTDTLTNRSITVGGGMTVSNGNGVSGNPVIGLNTTLQNLSALSGIGLMTIDGTSFSQVTLTGTSNQTTVSNGTGVGGNPTIGLASNAILPGTGGVQIPSGTSVQRLANNGVIRYNTDTTRFEGYQAGAWVNFGLGDGTVTSVTGTAHQISVTSGTTTPVIGIATNPTIPGTGSMVLPSGTTAERNALAFGALRYNTDTGGLEAYTQATGWGAIISGSGVSTFSGGSTGLTPSSPTSGGIILGGILNPTYGGTGVNNGSNTITLGGSLTTSGAYALTLTATGATNVTLPTTGTLTTLAGSETLTNKSMSGSSNTFTNIPNSALVNNSVTYNGVTVALGGSGTITATATNPLTVGTGLQLNSGTTYDGSAAKTISIDSTVATLSGLQTLTNKTMSGSDNTFSNIPNSALTNSAVTIGTTAISLGGTSLTLGGLTSVTVTQDPTADLQLATKQYVDSVAQGLNVKTAVLWGTTGNILLTGLTTQAGGEWTGTLTAGDRILVKNQLAAADNGIYAASALGWTRTTDANSWNELVSAFVFVEDGATLADTGWVCTVNPGGTLGVTPVTWTQFSGAGTYTAGTGLTLTGTQFSLTSPVAVSLGGTGQTSYTDGQLLIGNSSGNTLSKSTLTAGSGVSISNGNGSITISATGLGGDVVGPASSTDNAIVRFDGTTGKLIQNSGVTVDDSNNLVSPRSVQFSGAVPATTPIGTMWFDSSTDTLNIQQNNITQQIGEELFIYGKASNTITDSPLQIIYQTGTVGASGVITFGHTVAGITDGNLIIGVATESFATNAFGRITCFGIVHGITTDGVAFGETWHDGDVIWYNPVTGNPTNVKPTAPNLKVSVGTVINAGPGGSGSFQVEINHGSVLGGTDSNVQLSATPNNNDLLQYYSAGGYWRDVAASSVTVGTATNAVNVGVTANTTDTADYLAFVSATTGNHPILVNSSITVNPSAGVITGGIAGGAF